MKCPKCGNQQPIEEHHKVFYPSLSVEEANQRNYDKSRCQVCGHGWNKDQNSGETQT